MSEVNVMTWDEAAKREYGYGVSKAVLYKKNSNGVYAIAEPWNGITNISDKPSGADNTKLWADGIEYANMRAAEQYAASIEAYTYPDGFAECDGSAEPVEGMHISQQNRKIFGLCWRTEIGDAEHGEAYGYKLHLAYGLTASPSEKAYATVNDSPEAQTMSWEVEGTPVPMTGYKPTCKITLNSKTIDAAHMALIEKALYGSPATTSPVSAGSDAYLPTPDQIKAILDTVIPTT